MNIVIDMNLSPQWVEVFVEKGHRAIHWSEVGATNATDQEIMKWARSNTFIVFTHDLDFGTILANTDAYGPSVIQVRTQDTAPKAIAHAGLTALTRFEESLTTGAIVTIDEKRARARILPLGGRG